LWIRRQSNDDLTHEHIKEQGPEPCPDHFARPRVIVYFSQHVVEDVRDGKEYVARAKYDRGSEKREGKWQIEQTRLAGSDHVRTQQHGHEGGHDQFVVLVMSRAFLR